jgi:hypothetical protein
MAKKEVTAAETVAEFEQKKQETALTVATENRMSHKEVIAAFDGVKSTVPLVEWDVVTSNLISLEANKDYLILVDGMGEGINKDGEVFDVVEGRDESGYPCQIGDIMVVGTIERAIQNGLKFPWFYALHWDGTEKTGKGKYKMVHVRKCPLSPEDFIAAKNAKEAAAN